MAEAWTYLLQCADGSLYCGWTNDLQARVRTHQSGRGAKYTRARLPVRLVLALPMPDRAQAQSMEWQIKQLSRSEKLTLVQKHQHTLPHWATEYNKDR